MTCADPIPCAVSNAHLDANGSESEPTSSSVDFTDRALEPLLTWGDPIDGLRSAVFVRTTLDEQDERKNSISLAIQNVSDHAIRLADSGADKNKRTVYLHRSAEILMGLSHARSSSLDVVLQPEEIHLVDFFEGAEDADRINKDLCEGLFKAPSQSLSIRWNLASVPEGAWEGELKTTVSRGAIGVRTALPSSEEGRHLFDHFVRDTRLDGRIPNGMMQLLGERTEHFIQLNTGDAFGDTVARKMQPLVARFERTVDWEQSDVVSLLDEIATISTIPIDLSLEWIRERSLQRGVPLPERYRDANWGPPLPSGLRMAWMFEPRADAYPIHTPLRSTVLLHNSGKEPIAFATRSFQQPMHVALGGLGEFLATESVFWTTRGRPESYRLHPGEFCEVNAPGIRIGPREADVKDWSSVRVGTYLLVHPGDTVTFEPGEIALEASQQEGLPKDWWLATIRERLALASPLPDNEQDRELLLFRAVDDLFGTSPFTDELEAFAADTSPNALDRLSDVLAERSWIQTATGSIQSGVVTFRVHDADPQAATRPRIALNPGRYALSGDVALVVSRKRDGVRIINEASLVRYQDRKESISIAVPLPEGYDSWAAGWQPGSTLLWIAERGRLRSYDFQNPADIKTAEHDSGSDGIPIDHELKEALKPVFGMRVSSDAKQMLPPASLSSPAESAPAKSGSTELPSKHDEVNALMKHWRQRARLNGDIPGGALNVLHLQIDQFIKQYADEEQAASLQIIRSKLNTDRDWNERELVSLLDQIADLTTVPFAWAELKVSLRGMRDLQHGELLPDRWKDIAWGAPAENGLRAAWVLETQSKELHVGDVLKSRALFINGGTKTVYLQTDTWRQHDTHEALDGEGRSLKIEQIRYTGLTPTKTVCLRPGEFTEVAGHGIGIGDRAFDDEKSQGLIGAVVHAKPGDTLQFSTSMYFAGNAWRQEGDSIDPAARLRKQISDRVARVLPIPQPSVQSAEERRHLLIQITQELFGESPTVDELNAFLADDSAHPEESLIERLAARTEPKLFEGELKTGVQSFVVLPEDPQANAIPRAAVRPGRYTLRDGIRLQVSQTTTQESRTNQATLVFDAVAESPRREHRISLPDGLNSYAILWKSEPDVLYIVEQGKVRTIGLRNRDQVEERTDSQPLPPEFKDLIPEALR
ncbi:MAG: hypothetical protein WCI02_11150 [Planctomycetota bacterium]